MASSQFTPGEVLSIIVAWVVLSVALSVGAIEGLASNHAYIYLIGAAFIATATAFILHEMGHKFVAVRRGYVAHFRIWVWGIALTLITSIATGGAFLFGAPGAVYIAPAAAAGYFGYGFYSSNYKQRNEDHESMVISAAGPGMNLAFAVAFYFVLTLSAFGSFPWLVGLYGFELNVGLGAFNMLPIPPMDGFKIFKNNIAVALALGIPLWALAGYLFLFFRPA